ncbi:MAG: hypothetical protein K8R50_08180 [Betaproteobacteria bacterium]|nr:hypothetical protein [Betaproteobacteria bacterium]MCX7195787.1 hypothetical protein [Pseudomonadota bacterium]
MTSGVPEETAFAAKLDIALAQMLQTIVADIHMNLVLAQTFDITFVTS